MRNVWVVAILGIVAGAARAQERVAIQGVVFAHAWRFDQPVDFWVGGERRSFDHGELVGLAVHPDLFRPRSGLRPTIWVDDVAAIDRGGPFGDSAHPFVVIQLPPTDLSTARFWVGPREPADRVGAERVRTLRAEAEARGRMSGPLAAESVTAARAVMTEPAPRDARGIVDALRAFCRRTNLRTLRAFPF